MADVTNISVPVIPRKYGPGRRLFVTVVKFALKAGITPAQPDIDEVTTSPETLLAARTRHTATAFPGASEPVLVAGGFGPEDVVLASSELYDPDTQAWAATGDMGTARGSHVAVYADDDDHVYVFGGFGEGFSPLTSVERYSLATGLWTSRAAMGAGYGYPTACLIDSDTIFVLDTDGGGNVFSSLYSIAGDSWTATSAPPEPSAFATNPRAVKMLDGKVFVACGWTQAGGGRFEIYDPGDDSWTTAAFPTFGARSDDYVLEVLDDGKIFLAGGYYNIEA